MEEKTINLTLNKVQLARIVNALGMQNSDKTAQMYLELYGIFKKEFVDSEENTDKE